MSLRSTAQPMQPTRRAFGPAEGQRSAGKRDAILRAAIEIINAKGYAFATMSEIAAALNMRDGALYYYFASKQALAYAAHVQSLERFERTLFAASTAPTSGAQRIRAFLADFLEDSSRNGPQLYFGEHSYLDEAQRLRIDAWASRLTTVIEAMVDCGIEDRSVRPCETKLVVQLLLGMLIWLAKWVPSVDDLTPERLMRAIDDVALRGIASE